MLFFVDTQLFKLVLKTRWHTVLDSWCVLSPLDCRLLLKCHCADIGMGVGVAVAHCSCREVTVLVWFRLCRYCSWTSVCPVLGCSGDMTVSSAGGRVVPAAPLSSSSHHLCDCCVSRGLLAQCLKVRVEHIGDDAIVRILAAMRLPGFLWFSESSLCRYFFFFSGCLKGFAVSGEKTRCLGNFGHTRLDSGHKAFVSTWTLSATPVNIVLMLVSGSLGKSLQLNKHLSAFSSRVRVLF